MTDLARRRLDLLLNPALIVVDMSYGFTQSDSPLGGEFGATVDAAAELIQAFRSAGLSVIYTTVVYDSPEQASVFRERLPSLDILQRGSRWVEIDARVAPTDLEPVVEKQFPSAFAGTNLAQHLNTHEIDSLVVIGLTTSGCVRATVVDGLSQNYRVWVVKEAVGDRNLTAQDANLHDMNAKYAEVVSLSEAMDHLRQIGGHL
ncbi:MAG: isochorismatase family protein [Proteobacteria bacterium]|nr:isochorismatase family protein [Pseudomonadota bacterium]